MERATALSNVKTVMLPRNKAQGEALRKEFPHWFAKDKCIIPDRAVDGLSLLWASDLVVSGGGTMNREAAALGVPVYSVFRGATGAVDKFLEKEGKMVMLTSMEEVDSKVRFEKRVNNHVNGSSQSPAMLAIVDAIEKIIATSN
jgi:predicted glycosyltransferase